MQGQMVTTNPGRMHPNRNSGLGSPPIYVRDEPAQSPAHVVVLNYAGQPPPVQVEENPGNGLQRVLSGEEVVVSHFGASQYATPGGGVSACGIAALNCVRVVFGKERDGLRGEALLEDMMTRSVAEEIMSICAQWSSKSHLEVDDIYRVPLFETCLKRVDSRFSQPTFEQFRGILSALQSGPASNISSAMVITRPPEILACLKIVTETKPVFVVFDSHPRPKHPNGAGFIFNTSSEATATHLHELLAVDSRLLADRSMQWQAHLLGSFSADIFIPNDSVDSSNMPQVILESSMALLTLKSQLSEQKSTNDALGGENRRLQSEIGNLKASLKLVSADLKSAQARGKKMQKQDTNRSWASPGGFLSWFDSASEAGPSRSSSQRVYDDFSYPGQSRSSTQRVPGDISNPGFSSSSGQNDRWERHPSPVRTATQDPQPPLLPRDESADLAYVLQLSRAYEEEDRRLRQEREDLDKYTQRVFECGICFDEYSDEDIAKVEGCEHAYCRDCLRKYILTKVREHRFPIICPICATDKGRKIPGEINQFLIQNVGIPNKDYAVFEELQLTGFSVFVHCRKCKKTSFVDKVEYQSSRIVACPLPKCNHIWCKTCQQPVAPGGPDHSCDGSSELKHLMKEQGWKHCPGCKTPIQKTDGCNHMTCTSPGCNMHFCYLCGGAIVQSSLGNEVKDKLATHYRKCTLFVM